MESEKRADNLHKFDVVSENMGRLLGVQFTPLNLSLKERLQTLLLAFWVFSFLFLGPTCAIFVIWLAFTRAWPLVLLYTIWYLYDTQTSNRQGRRSEWCRRWKVWEYFRDYFPLKLIKTVEISSDKNYVFGCHPHGIFAVSHFCNFATEATGFSQLFPGLTPHLTVLDGNFRFPLYREIFMWPGFRGCNKNGIEYILSSQMPGNAVCIAVGGAREIMEAHPGRFTLILARRKGFIRIAIKTGADLVPVFSFGENDLFQQVSNPVGSKLRAFQDSMSLPPPLFYGRGIFTYNVGFLPHRKPITTVVGKPIEVNKNAFPTDREVCDLHAKYMAALSELFESHKHKYGIPETTHLTFV